MADLLCHTNLSVPCRKVLSIRLLMYALLYSMCTLSCVYITVQSADSDDSDDETAPVIRRPRPVNDSVCVCVCVCVCMRACMCTCV